LEHFSFLDGQPILKLSKILVCAMRSVFGAQAAAGDVNKGPPGIASSNCFLALMVRQFRLAAHHHPELTLPSLMRLLNRRNMRINLAK
jgi:hypothetical protein